MGEKFQADLSLFTNLFRTISSIGAPHTVDVSSPPPTVIDLSRIAARGTYFNATSQLTATVGERVFGEVYSDTTLDTVDGLKGDRLNLDLWIMDVALGVGNTANFDSAAAFVQPTRDPPNGVAQYSRPFAAWDSTSVNIGIPSLFASDKLYLLPIFRHYGPVLARRSQLSTLPRSGLLLSLKANAQGTVSGLFNYTLWIGPRGATPPGLS